MATMIFADEVLPADRIEEIKEAEEVSTTKRELEIAEQLVESLAGDFEPDRWHDAYREQVLEMIERKAGGEEIAVQPEPEEVAAPAPDLMGALKASLEAVQAREGEDGAAKKAKAKRKAPAKATAKKEAAKKAPKSAGRKSGAKRSTAKAGAKS
jgi:DNA end-binding protein Ku